MKLPSIQSLYQGLFAVIKRFPITLLFAIIAMFAACKLIDLNDYRSHPSPDRLMENLLVKTIAICNIGLTLTLALDLFAEKKNFPALKKWALRLFAVLFCFAHCFLLNPSEYLIDTVKIGLLIFAFHLFVAIAPFLDKGHVNGFWQFNKILFLRFLTAALYAAVLFGGLAVALVAIDGLFNVDIRWNIYVTVFAVIAAGFSPVFFLAGIPADFAQLDEDSSYPKGLKIFTQFVLIPLMTIYLAILLFYEIKIIINWSLPKGLVSSLIIGYAVFGILSLLLVYPMKEKEGNSWIKLFSKFFYIMLVPLIVLLLLAVWKRVGPYGITESRYILVMLALWLSGITIYFLISKHQNIKVIPVSLAILTLLAVYGPQSASGVSKYSQMARLNQIINSKQKDDLSEKPALIRHLVSRYGLTVMQKYTSTDLAKIEDKIDLKNDYKYARENEKVDTIFKILKVKEQEHAAYYVQYRFINPEEQFINVKGYDYMLEIDNYTEISKDFKGLKILLKRDNAGTKTTLNIGEDDQLIIDNKQIFNEMVKRADAGKLKASKNSKEFYLPADQIFYSKTVSGYQFTFVVSSIDGNKNDRENIQWINSNGYLLIKKL